MKRHEVPQAHLGDHKLDYIIDGQPMSYWAIKNRKEMEQWLLTRSPIYSRYNMAPQLFACIVDYETEQLIARKLERMKLQKSST